MSDYEWLSTGFVIAIFSALVLLWILSYKVSSPLTTHSEDDTTPSRREKRGGKF
jgi:hypothetical protein